MLELLRYKTVIKINICISEISKHIWNTIQFRPTQYPLKYTQTGVCISWQIAVYIQFKQKLQFADGL